MLGFLKRRRHPIGEVDLSAYVDGRVSPDERRRLEEHLRSCAACTRKLEGLRTVVAELRRLPPVALPRSFALTATQAALGGGKRPAAEPLRWPAAGRLYLALRDGAVAAAVLFVLVGAGSLIVSRGEIGGENSGTLTGPVATGQSSALSEGSGTTRDTEDQNGMAPNKGYASPMTAVPGVAPLLPGVAPSVAPTATVPAFEKTAANPARTVEDRDGRRWLWALEGTAGGLALGLGVSAFWLRRLARRG
jgi:hypothetical protein